jgi:predicted 2-oxoglutarate/Fe(II)-dependent dioxygenase YbiX
LPQTLQLLAGKSILKDLDENGYVVVDSAPKTSELQHQQMSTFLELKAEKTNQGDHVRRDSVHFLARDEAISCGLEEHYELLMSIASHLNDNLNFRPSDHEAVFPGTNDKPLTNPALIQIAEYNQGGFYVAHSDNSLSSSDGDGPTIRTSFRHYTCILYCNEDWRANSMGGALRLYPGSRNCLKPIDATKRLDYVDVNPINGRLLIFDSCLVHSVNEVTQSRQARRALTLWINRPDDSGVRGERFF